MTRSVLDFVVRVVLLHRTETHTRNDDDSIPNDIVQSLRATLQTGNVLSSPSVIFQPVSTQKYYNPPKAYQVAVHYQACFFLVCSQYRVYDLSYVPRGE